ncbi:trypsin-like peptidase domain-containing protein [Mycobacterium sp. PS03-16]|uniref:trypsin-like peptidase domain-containing protein n=1 Tax=Mycobacterium sp. PS03-16 TaxID=2559611 RepID=UPI0014308817|nr:trypsin-like peptidase domain-containing protein [Mycobacterium sp. PS03-16]
MCSVVAVTALAFAPGAVIPATVAAQPDGSSSTRAADLIKPAIVYIETKISGTVVDPHQQQTLNDGAVYQASMRCTGFAITADGYIGTAGHCVDPDENRKAIVMSAAEQLSGGPVGRAELEQLGANAWTVEGKVPGGGPDQEILVSGAGQREQANPIPARVVTFRPLGQGDVALLKVELSETTIPTAQLALDSTPQVGDEVLAVGYPDSTQGVTDYTLDPTVKSGTVSAKQTWKTQPLFQVSAPMSKGMSGGPTVDLQGRVIGVNSFMPSNEDQPFNFIAPVSGFNELLGQANVTPELSPADEAYRQGLEEFDAGNYSGAIEKFDTALAMSHQYPGALDKRTEAVKLRAERGDAPTGAPSWVIYAAIVGALVVIGGGVLAFVMMRRNREPAVAEMGASPHQQYAPSGGAAARRAPMPAPAPGPAPSAPSLDASQTACKNCGFGMEAGVRFCPRCGKPQS